MSNFEMNSFTTKNGKSLKITFFKHASLLLDYAGQKIFIDPVSDYADYIQIVYLLLVDYQYYTL